ncbi:hypothetical protein [Mesorhizobium sp. CAU 1741]|uniref:hypothetical protein n=1 Tax=Mesorhizobium sp. CAU 1741 TaxID=3140366 RepID=UPI00325ABCE9
MTGQGFCSYFVLMPEEYRPKRGIQPLMLSGAIKNGSLINARCVGCSPPRWYHPTDLMRLYGDVPAVNLERLMKCGSCGSALDTAVVTPTADERQKIRLRRLHKVWWVRRATWREE